MPAWNESEGLPGFLQELQTCIEYPCTFHVVDDHSSDDTVQELRRCAAMGLPVAWTVNDLNYGHGISTLAAWRLGLDQPSDLIVAVDGDGQFRGQDVNDLINAVISGDADVGEGVRQERGEAWFRRATSFMTRFLVWTRCGKWPQDANTPLRVYRPPILKDLLEKIPPDSLTPNLLVSVITRRQKNRLVEYPVASIDRRGSTEHGSTWGNRQKALPTRKFVTFCWKAITQWISYVY